MAEKDRRSSERCLICAVNVSSRSAGAKQRRNLQSDVLSAVRLKENVCFCVPYLSSYLTAENTAFLCGSCTCRLNRFDNKRQKFEAARKDLEENKKQIHALCQANQTSLSVSKTKTRSPTPRKLKNRCVSPLTPLHARKKPLNVAPELRQSPGSFPCLKTLREKTPTKLPVPVRQPPVPMGEVERVQPLAIPMAALRPTLQLTVPQMRAVVGKVTTQLKGKCRKSLFSGDPSSSVQQTTSRPCISLQPPKVTAKEEHYAAKVTVRYGMLTKSYKTVYFQRNESQNVKIARGLVEGGTQGTVMIMKAVLEDKDKRSILRREFLRELATECQILCQLSRPSLLRKIQPGALLKLDLEEVVKEWSERSALLYEVLTTIMGKSHPRESQAYPLAVAGSILLHQRNRQLSAIQNSLGLLLDFGGTRDKTLRVLAMCGVSVSTVTLCRRKDEIQKYHTELVSLGPIRTRDRVINTLNASPCQIPTSCKIPSEHRSWAIYGDNLDHRVHSFHATKGHWGQDIHWFLLVGAPNRVMPPVDLDRRRPRRDITDVMNSEFLPCSEDNTLLAENFKFHIMEAMVKYVPCLQHMKGAVPKFIQHQHVQEMSKKSAHLILDLLDKNENKGDEMIDILRNIHTFVPHLPISGINTLERIVFGGDVLSNERAYQAQLQLMNATNEMDKLLGIIHRPEGLHMCMNFCKYILEVFFSRSSVRESGTLYNLSILLSRLKITLDMTTGYNKARNFINDALDGHILGAVCSTMGLQDPEDCPKESLPSETASKSEMLNFLSQLAQKVLEKYVLATDCTDDALQGMLDTEHQSQCIQSMADAEATFHCNFRGCNKKFRTAGWLSSHLKKQHNVVIDAGVPKSKQQGPNYDGQFNYASAFMKVALLYRDLTDAYKMGDGDRVFRDVKFLFLHLSPGKHMKYRLWLWRMLAYDLALLSLYERYEYRYNIAMNLTGGVRNCVANDNAVEIHVHKVKEAMRAMGANVSYTAVRKATKCLNVLESMMERLAPPKSGKHAATKTHADVKEVAACLLANNIFIHSPGREHQTYPQFPSDILNDVDMVKLNKWINAQKLRAKIEMQAL